MAINPASSIKSIGLLTIGVGGTGLGVYYREEIWEMINSDFQTFLVEVVDASIGEDEIKNSYKCRLNKKIDKNCALSSFVFNKEQFVNSKGISYSEDFQEKKLKEKSFYKLSINQTIINDVSVGSEIELIDTKDTPKPKVFGKLKAIAVINNTYSKIPNNMLLAKADTTIFSTSPITDFNCKVKNATGDSDVELTCKIYKLHNSPKKIPTVDFSNLTEVTDLKEIQANQYYAVDFSSDDETQKNNLITSNFSKIELWNKTDPKKVQSTLSFKSKLFGKFAETEKTDNFSFLFSEEDKNKTPTSTYILGDSKKNGADNNVSPISADNYKCKVNGVEDDDCQIAEVTGGGLNINLTIKKNDDPKQNTNLNNANKIYKVVAKNEFINSITKWDGSEQIEIINKTDNKKYGTINARYLIEKEKLIKGQTNKFFVKAKTITTDSKTINEKTTKYRCSWDTKDDECTISKFTKQPTVDDKNLSTTKIGKTPDISNFSDLKVDDYYVINLSKKQESLTEESLKTFTLKIEIITKTIKVVPVAPSLPLVSSNGSQTSSQASTSQSQSQGTSLSSDVSTANVDSGLQSRKKRSTDTSTITTQSSSGSSVSGGGSGTAGSSVGTSSGSANAGAGTSVTPGAGVGTVGAEGVTGTPTQSAPVVVPPQTREETVITYEELGTFESLFGIFYKNNNLVLL